MDDEIRLSAFNWLQEQTDLYGDVLPRHILADEFVFHGERITLLGPQGIWKPKVMDLPISITTIHDGPYDDSISDDGYIEYKYRGIDPMHTNNIGLRTLMQNQIPLIYFHSLVKSQYFASWPVFIIADDPESLTFTVAVDEVKSVTEESAEIKVAEDQVAYRRSYLTSSVRKRLHQRSFRERVLLAYHSRCTMCKLKHRELLDAAHIISDSEENGQPVVQNGLSLCKIHHSAFDQNILGISPDYEIKVREDILEEVDGPMLKHGIQALQNKTIILPRTKSDWPDKDRLDFRYQKFLKAS